MRSWTRPESWALILALVLLHGAEAEATRPADQFQRLPAAPQQAREVSSTESAQLLANQLATRLGLRQRGEDARVWANRLETGRAARFGPQGSDPGFAARQRGLVGTQQRPIENPGAVQRRGERTPPTLQKQLQDVRTIKTQTSTALQQAKTSRDAKKTKVLKARMKQLNKREKNLTKQIKRRRR